MHGYVIDRRDVHFDLGRYSDDSDTQTYIVVDDGLRNYLYAWQTDHDERDAIPVGSAVSARVAGDRRYLYQLTRARVS